MKLQVRIPRTLELDAVPSAQHGDFKPLPISSLNLASTLAMAALRSPKAWMIFAVLHSSSLTLP